MNTVAAETSRLVTFGFQNERRPIDERDLGPRFGVRHHGGVPRIHSIVSREGCTAQRPAEHSWARQECEPGTTLTARLEQTAHGFALTLVVFGITQCEPLTVLLVLLLGLLGNRIDHEHECRGEVGDDGRPFAVGAWARTQIERDIAPPTHAFDGGERTIAPARPQHVQFVSGHRVERFGQPERRAVADHQNPAAIVGRITDHVDQSRLECCRHNVNGFDRQNRDVLRACSPLGEFSSERIGRTEIDDDHRSLTHSSGEGRHVVSGHRELSIAPPRPFEQIVRTRITHQPCE